MIFLLEYNKDSYDAHKRRYEKTTPVHSVLRSLSKKGKRNEFYLFTRQLEESGLPFKFIDTDAPEAKEELVGSMGLKELLRFFFSSRGIEELMRTSPQFKKFMMRREGRMAEEILSVVADGRFINHLVFVGEDHVERLSELLKERIPADVEIRIASGSPLW